MEKELSPLGYQLEERVDHLTDGLGNGRLANHVLEAEDHAKQLNESAAILDRYPLGQQNNVYRIFGHCRLLAVSHHHVWEDLFVYVFLI